MIMFADLRQVDFESLNQTCTSLVRLARYQARHPYRDLRSTKYELNDDPGICGCLLMRTSSSVQLHLASFERFREGMFVVPCPERTNGTITAAAGRCSSMQLARIGANQLPY